MQFQTRRGFTLIELIVVVSIIGMLAAVSTFSYRSSLVTSRDARRRADLEQLRGALELYRSNNNAYPLTAAFSLICTATGGLTDASNTYLSLQPRDPRCTTQNYTYSGTATDYTIGALLESTTTTCSVSLDCSSTQTGTQTCNYCVGPYGTK